MIEHLIAAAKEVLGTDGFSVRGTDIVLPDFDVVMPDEGDDEGAPVFVERLVAGEQLAAINGRAVELSAIAAAQAERETAFPNLEPDQFWGVLRATGYEQPLRDWIATIADPAERGFVSAKLEFAKFFERDHPLIEAAQMALGIADGELDALWRYGAG
jgi:hypothetical protein